MQAEKRRREFKARLLVAMEEYKILVEEEKAEQFIEEFDGMLGGE